MKRKHTMDGARQAIGRDGEAVKNRRTFLTDAGKYGALLAGGTFLASTAGLENPASAQGDDLAQGTAEALAGYDAKEKGDMVRIFGVGRRAPGMLRGDMRRKTFIMWTGYANASLREATGGALTGGQLLFIMNFINEAAFGSEGDTDCLPFVERDFVAEYFMRGQAQAPGRGGQAQATGGGREAQATEGGGEAQATGRGGRAQANARPTFPPSAENGTDVRLAAKQVLAEGKRPLGVAGRERGMYFIKLSANIARDDQVKTWQALHDKAMARAKMFASELVGFELLQRLPNTPDKLTNRCGPEVPVPELVACFWSKSKRGAGEFPTYARAFRQADQQRALDAPSSFFLMTEEWTVQESQQLIR